jgi:hypothetical protein
MARQNVETTDTLNEGRGKVNNNFTELYAGQEIVDGSQSSDYTLVLSDKNKVVDMSSASASNLTVPPNSAVAFPVGSIIGVKRSSSTGQVTIVAGLGVTITASAEVYTDPGQNLVMSLRKTATDTWDLQNGASGLTWTSWTPVHTGFTGTPTVNGQYIIEGKKVTLRGVITGTSVMADFTITNLPLPAKLTTHNICLITNSGTNAVGIASTGAGTSVLTFYATVAFGVFTGSGTKAAFFSITYEAE